MCLFEETEDEDPPVSTYISSNAASSPATLNRSQAVLSDSDSEGDLVYLGGADTHSYPHLILSLTWITIRKLCGCSSGQTLVIREILNLIVLLSTHDQSYRQA